MRVGCDHTAGDKFVNVTMSDGLIRVFFDAKSPRNEIITWEQAKALRSALGYVLEHGFNDKGEVKQ